MRPIGGLFFVISLLVVPIDQAKACSCVETSLDTQLRDSDLVFEGRLVREEVVSRDERILHFLVTRQWKGELQERRAIHTSRHEGTCGFTAQLSVYYLIFAQQNDAGEFMTSLCSGNQTADSAEAQAFSQRHGGAVTPVNIAPGASDNGSSASQPSPSRAGCQSCSLSTRSSDEWPLELGLFLVGLGLLSLRRRR